MACIWVLAGTNGAGKSSVGGAVLRASGGVYFNPDEAAAKLRSDDPKLDATSANAMAWRIGAAQLRSAVASSQSYFFETTLGGNTITALLHQALDQSHEVRIWYAALDSPERHIARVAARVRRGGHDIPQDAIRARYDDSRRNLISLLPRLTELKVFDNSFEADPTLGVRPEPALVMHWRGRRVIAPAELQDTPDWAKPIVARALKAQPRTLEEIEEGLADDIRRRHPKP